jgi:hypothetical protein
MTVRGLCIFNGTARMFILNPPNQSLHHSCLAFCSCTVSAEASVNFFEVYSATLNAPSRHFSNFSLCEVKMKQRKPLARGVEGVEEGAFGAFATKRSGNASQVDGSAVTATVRVNVEEQQSCDMRSATSKLCCRVV